MHAPVAFKLSLRRAAETDIVSPTPEERHESELGRNRLGRNRSFWLRRRVVHGVLQAVAGGHPLVAGRVAVLHGPPQLLAVHYFVSVQFGNGPGYLLGYGWLLQVQPVPRRCCRDDGGDC